MGGPQRFAGALALAAAAMLALWLGLWQDGDAAAFGPAYRAIQPWAPGVAAENVPHVPGILQSAWHVGSAIFRADAAAAASATADENGTRMNADERGEKKSALVRARRRPILRADRNPQGGGIAWALMAEGVGAIPAGSEAAPQDASSLTVNLGLHSHRVSGIAPRPETVELRLVRGTELIASATATPVPDARGAYWYTADIYERGWNSALSYPPFLPGDLLQATQAGQSTAVTVPQLSAWAEQSPPAVYGRAPALAPLTLYGYRDGEPGLAWQRAVTATAAGTYLADLSDLAPLQPADYGFVFHADGAGNHVYVRYNVPFLRVGLDTGRVDGVVAPLADVQAENLSGPAGERAPGSRSSPEGRFTATLAPDARPGDLIRVTASAPTSGQTQVVTVTVPLLTARADATRDLVGGEAPAEAAVELYLYRGPPGSACVPAAPDFSPDHRLAVTATAAGAYTADFTGVADVSPGDYGFALIRDTAGHQAHRRFVVPLLQAQLGAYRLDGLLESRAAITVTIWSSQGVTRTVRFVRPSAGGCFTDETADTLWTLPGDHIVVARDDGPDMAVELPRLTAVANAARGTVFGQAPPNSLLRVGISPAAGVAPRGSASGGPGPAGTSPDAVAYPYNVWVTSGPDGTYEADLGGQVALSPGDSGAVFLLQPGGGEAYVEFTVPVVRAQRGSNYVAGWLPAPARRPVVRLYGPDGRIKGQAEAQTDLKSYSGPFEAYLFTPENRPAIIEAGDTVQVAADRETMTVLIPGLDIQADRATDTIWGQAPPRSLLQVAWYSGDSFASPRQAAWITASGEDGSFRLAVADRVNVERGDRVEVWYTGSDGNQVWSAFHLPRITLSLADNFIFVLGQPHSPLSLQLLDPGGAPVYTATTAIGNGGYAALYPYTRAGVTYLSAGQTVIADLPAEAMTLTVPYLTAVADAENDTVSGAAPPGASLLVTHPNTSSGGRPVMIPVTATAGGTFSVTFRGRLDIALGDKGNVIYLAEDGQRVWQGFTTPSLWVTLGSAYLNGVVPAPGPLTITVRSPDGAVKAGRVTSTGRDMYFFVAVVDERGEAVPVASGDVVSAETAGDDLLLVVPSLTGDFDPRTGILTGTGPAGDWLRVAWGSAERRVKADNDGRYALDWSDQILRPGEWLAVVHMDRAGNQTTLPVRLTRQRSYLPVFGK